MRPLVVGGIRSATMRLRRAHSHLFALIFFAGILYGTTYQQFRYFDLNEPGGALDALRYVEMSRGDLDVDFHRYRWPVPMAAGALRPLIEKVDADEQEVVKLSFYVVNFSLSLGTCLVLFFMLDSLGFSYQLS